MAKILGLDESGRGPVLAPMVMCGVVIDESKEHLFKEIGCKDSKMLLPKKRAELFEKIYEIADSVHIKIIEPKEIDDALEHPANNLNRLEAQKSAEIILDAKPDIAILDCPSVNISAYKYDVTKHLGDLDVDIKPSHKADVYFPCVAAASIIAKHTRDTILEKLKKEHNADFGSGYMSDPKTVIFLEEHWDDARFSKLFRKSWSSWKKIKLNQAQTQLAEW